MCRREMPPGIRTDAAGISHNRRDSSVPWDDGRRRTRAGWRPSRGREGSVFPPRVPSSQSQHRLSTGVPPNETRSAAPARPASWRGYTARPCSLLGRSTYAHRQLLNPWSLGSLGDSIAVSLVTGRRISQYSEIRDLVSCPPSLSESHLFVCNFCFSLHADPFQ